MARTDRFPMMTHPLSHEAAARPGLRTLFAGWESWAVLALVLLAVLLLDWRWVGFQGHDQASYLTASLDWLNHFPFIGATHWALRYPLVLPTAAAIKLLGPTTFALALVNLVAYAGLLVGGYLAMRHWFGPLAAVLLTLIWIVLPQFLVQATYTNPDLVETSLSMGAFWLLMLARERGGPRGLLIASGVLAGLGYLTRETVVMALIVFAAIWLLKPRIKRLRYAWVAVGFALVVGAQTTYLAVRTGDFFYRARLSASLKVDRELPLQRAEATGHVIDTEGVLTTPPVLGPFAAVFISQKYGLLFILAIPAAILLRRRRDLTREQRDVAGWTAFGALESFLFVAVNATILYVVPRYFMLAAGFASVPPAILASYWLRSADWRRVVAALGLSAFVATSLLLLYLENTHPLRAEERIADFVAHADKPVHVDPETRRELGYFLLARGLEDRVTTAAPGPGDLVASQDGVVQTCLRTPDCAIKDQMRQFVPQGDWTTVARIEPPTRLLATLLEPLGLRDRLPTDLWRRLTQPGSTAVIYQLPPN